MFSSERTRHSVVLLLLRRPGPRQVARSASSKVRAMLFIQYRYAMSSNPFGLVESPAVRLWLTRLHGRRRRRRVEMAMFTGHLRRSVHARSNDAGLVGDDDGLDTIP